MIMNSLIKPTINQDRLNIKTSIMISMVNQQKLLNQDTEKYQIENSLLIQIITMTLHQRNNKKEKSLIIEVIQLTLFPKTMKEI